MIKWVVFGFALSMVPLVIVAFMGWAPTTEWSGLGSLLCNEELLAVGLTLGGASVADVLTNNVGPLRSLKLVIGGFTLIATVLSVAGYVAIKAHSLHLNPDQIVTVVVWLAGATVAGAGICEVLAEL